MGSAQIAAVARAPTIRVEIMPNVCGLIAFILFSIAYPDKRYMISWDDYVRYFVDNRL